MPGQMSLPAHNDDLDPLKKWLTKKQAMKFLDIGRTTFSEYKKYSLKTSRIGNKERVHQDDLDEFLRTLENNG